MSRLSAEEESSLSVKILVTGAGGQLGRELQRSVPAALHCVALSRAELDIGDPRQVDKAFAEHRPAAVINAAAYTAVDRAESELAEAMRINAEGPGNLARACAASGARLVHVSTDFVFDGSASRPYAPDAEPAPLGAYGRSKLEGELRVREALPQALILRTAWVYSSLGANFVRTMLRLMGERDELSVVADQVGTPTWAAGLAQAIWAALARPQLAGTYHWTDAGVCSWYDFAVAIAEEALELGLLPRASLVRPIPTEAYPTPAQRPAYSVLDKSDSWRELELAPVHWRVQLRSMLQELKES